MSNAQFDADFNLSRQMEVLEKENEQRYGGKVHARFDPEFPLDNIHAPDNENFRYAKGQTVGGFVLEDDRRNISGMADEIRQLRGINTPLVVVERADGTFWLKQGFRRYNAAKLIRQTDSGSPLANKLANVPVLIYSGMTEEQEKTLVNDQKSKKFSKAEVFGMFLREIRGGYHWANAAYKMYRQIGDVMDSAEMVRKMDDITDDTKRQEEVKAWLNSSVYQGWYAAIRSSPLLTELWMQTYLFQDGFKGVKRPRVLMTSLRQRALTSEILKDQTAGEFDSVKGTGPRLEKKLDEFSVEDSKKYNENGERIKPTPDPAAQKLKTLKDVQDLIKAEEDKNNGQPTLLSRVYRVTLKNGGDPEACSLIRNFDACRAVLAQHREFLKPSVAALCNMLLNGNDGSAEEFAKELANNYATAEPEVIPEPVIQDHSDTGNEYSLTEGATDGGTHKGKGKKAKAGAK